MWVECCADKIQVSINRKGNKYQSVCTVPIQIDLESVLRNLQTVGQSWA